MNGYDASGYGVSDAESMHVIVRLADGTEVAYRCDKVTVCPDPYGLTSCATGFPWRPAGPYVVVEAAEVVHIDAGQVARG